MTHGPDPLLRDLAPADLDAARELLQQALPWDRAGVVAAEKLYGGNGRRDGQTIGAFSPAGALLGVLSQAGRWIKLLAVRPDAQQRGVGTALLAAARAFTAAQPGRTPSGQRPRLRIGDHPGNYLSPGLDERYTGAVRFLRDRGFVEIARCTNMRAPIGDNPLITPARSAALDESSARDGYTLRRAAPGDVPALTAMIEAAFAPVWAYEVARALGPGLGGEPAAHTPALPEGAAVHVALGPSGAPVAFAAHDGNNRGLGWFGPMGTLEAHRGHGLGEALLLRCLLDVRDRPEGGVIAWVGPAAFYTRACGAQPDRRFIVFEET